MEKTDCKIIGGAPATLAVKGLMMMMMMEEEEGSGEQGKLRKLVAKSSVVPQRPSRLRD